MDSKKINIIKKELGKIFPSDRITFEKEDLICYSFDGAQVSFMPDGVVFPVDAVEISKLLKLANFLNFPVVPRGAGSGMTGGSLAVEGGIVLSTERMINILEIDKANQFALVEPGVINGDLQKAVEKENLFYPPDPASLKFSTIGGNIAECAGGPRAFKYGVTKDYVQALEVVLPNGDIVHTGTKTVKGVVGYDLTRLIVGSEGTLGVVTKALLKLIPKPETKKTILAVFDNLNESVKTITDIIGAGLRPATLEFMDETCIEAVRGNGIDYLPANSKGLLLIDVDGDVSSVKEETKKIVTICESRNAVLVKVAEGDSTSSAYDSSGVSESDKLWAARRIMSQSLKKIKPHKTNEDVVVPRSKIVDLIEGTRDIAKTNDVIIVSFGHGGDGNIHTNIMVDKNDYEEMARGEKAVKEVFELTVKLGGTISGEHGVGIMKSDYIGLEMDSATINLMKAIKKSLDPNNILNPGKIFEPSPKQK